MNKIRIAINGFGRIGRTLTRVLADESNIELVAINDLGDIGNLAHLLKYDTIHGRFPKPIYFEDSNLFVDGHKIAITHNKNPNDINWKLLDLDFIIEATGMFRTYEHSKVHLKNAKRVILSAPALDDTKTIVMGINDEIIQRDDLILSNASCTTNSAAPLVKIVNDICDVEHAYITTVHSYTTDQKLQDAPHKDYRRGRAAAESIVPTTTGAAKAITRVIPKLEGRIGGAGIRVPVPDGSLTDITFSVGKASSMHDINDAFLEASEKGRLHGILGYTKDPIVSRDVIGSPYSCLFDEELTSVLGKMVKVVGWYDNEMGYSHRLKDLMLSITKNFG